MPFAIGSIFNYLVQPLVGATRKDVVDVLEASRAAHPALDLFILEGGHAPRLLTGERERWSWVRALPSDGRRRRSVVQTL